VTPSTNCQASTPFHVRNGRRRIQPSVSKKPLPPSELTVRSTPGRRMMTRLPSRRGSFSPSSARRTRSGVAGSWVRQTPTASVDRGHVAGRLRVVGHLANRLQHRTPSSDGFSMIRLSTSGKGLRMTARGRRRTRRPGGRAPDSKGVRPSSAGARPSPSSARELIPRPPPISLASTSVGLIARRRR